MADHPHVAQLKEDMPCVRLILLPSSFHRRLRPAVLHAGRIRSARVTRPTTSADWRERLPSHCRGCRLRREGPFDRGEREHADDQRRQAAKEEQTGEALIRASPRAPSSASSSLPTMFRSKSANVENGLLHVDLVRGNPRGEEAVRDPDRQRQRRAAGGRDQSRGPAPQLQNPKRRAPVPPGRFRFGGVGSPH